MLRKYLLRRSCSDGPIFRRSFVQKVLCLEGSMFRKNSLQGPIFKRSCVPKVLCSERLMLEHISIFQVQI